MRRGQGAGCWKPTTCRGRCDVRSASEAVPYSCSRERVLTSRVYWQYTAISYDYSASVVEDEMRAASGGDPKK
jgi:hypothetical protein